jgi:hypothetical protein
MLSEAYLCPKPSVAHRRSFDDRKRYSASLASAGRTTEIGGKSDLSHHLRNGSIPGDDKVLKGLTISKCHETRIMLSKLSSVKGPQTPWLLRRASRNSFLVWVCTLGAV